MDIGYAINLLIVAGLSYGVAANSGWVAGSAIVVGFGSLGLFIEWSNSFLTYSMPWGDLVGYIASAAVGLTAGNRAFRRRVGDL